MEANFKICLFVKTNSVIEFLADIDGTQGTFQSVRWPCETTILSIGHFESPTEVQLNS